MINFWNFEKLVNRVVDIFICFIKDSLIDI